MLPNQFALLGVQGLFLLRHPVLLYRHADVHRQGGVTKYGFLHGRPFQDIASGNATHHTYQHRVGAAVAIQIPRG